MLHPLLNTALQAARKASNIITKGFDRRDLITIEDKDLHNYVTDIDRRAEQAIIETIRNAHPNHSILAEESGQHPGDEHVWIIDPLDGTNNFIHGFPHFAISIAIQIKGRLEHGLIYDPIKDELFTASRGKGAQLNNQRIRVSNTTSLNHSFIAMGAAIRTTETLRLHYHMLDAISGKIAGLRRTGSASLDLAYVAAGRLDGFWELGLSSWDVAAGSLLIKEAGGLVGNFHGGDDVLDSGQIVAGSTKVFKGLLQILHTFKE